MHLIYLQRIDFPSHDTPTHQAATSCGQFTRVTVDEFGVHSVLFTPSNKAEPQRPRKVLECSLMR